jgi:exopolysaccharide biosynthesis polyprenyl glycosylphosphotransferase
LQLINVRALALTKYQRLVKRGFDLVLGCILSVLSLPLMAVLAVLIRFDSPGPVVFKQRRVGENGQLFTMYKFRSMYHNYSQSSPINAVHSDSETIIMPKQMDDPRITRVGRFIRRTSLDELPQFFNVIRGEMSLVGPRPEMPELVKRYHRWQRQRFAIPQGVTGWWQINGRSDRPMQQHTEDDLYYIQHYSLLLDLIILWRTLFVVLRRRGAY